jgi:hypothetical protein
MLWEDDTAYREHLYGLDTTGLRLRSGYWGVQPRLYPSVRQGDTDSEEAPDDTAARTRLQGGASAAGVDAAAGSAGGGDRLSDDAGGPRARAPGTGAQATARPAPTRGAARPDPPSPVALYVRSLGQVFPLLLWLFAVVGIAGSRERGALRREIPVAGALVGTSVAIAVVVAVDPRTQLFLAPLLAFYAARGFGVMEEIVRDRMPDAPLRPGFVEAILAATALVWLLGIDARRLYLSLSLGSPHHIVAAQNRDVARELDTLLDDDDGPVASWHPAIAVYADRDWRVLPYAGLPEIVRYLDAAGADALVLSAYYPPDLGVEDLDTRYLVLPVPDAGGPPHPWRLRLLQGDTIRAVGRLEPATASSEESPRR